MRVRMVGLMMASDEVKAEKKIRKLQNAGCMLLESTPLR